MTVSTIVLAPLQQRGGDEDRARGVGGVLAPAPCDDHPPTRDS